MEIGGDIRSACDFDLADVGAIADDVQYIFGQCPSVTCRDTCDQPGIRTRAIEQNERHIVGIGKVVVVGNRLAGQMECQADFTEWTVRCRFERDLETKPVRIADLHDHCVTIVRICTIVQFGGFQVQ
ncbi:MAG: hypothetical protein ACO1O3_07135 [Sphingobium sp.]